MQLIAGLGNPGDQYRNNRHNIGFLAVDAIARRHGFPPFRQKFSGLLSDGQVGRERVLLLKPQTFMNRSGDSLVQALQFYKLEPGDVTVLYDELDLQPGKVRVKTGGGNGGHNGLRSIDPAIGQNYRRVRLGIGHPGHKDRVTSHVLSDFHKADQAWLEPLLAAVADNAELLLKGDDANFMNRLALALQGAPDTAPVPEKPGRKAQSHVRQARQSQSQVKLPETGPMAQMLKKLFGGER